MDDSDIRPFPIQREHAGYGKKEESTIPWWLAEIAYEWYAEKYGTQQSLKRLAERGGFGRRELISLIRQGKNPC